MKVTDYDGGKFRTGPKFYSQLGMFTEETPMEEVLTWIFNLVDTAYVKDREYRIYEMSVSSIEYQSTSLTYTVHSV